MMISKKDFPLSIKQSRLISEIESILPTASATELIKISKVIWGNIQVTHHKPLNDEIVYVLEIPKDSVLRY